MYGERWTEGAVKATARPRLEAVEDLESTELILHGRAQRIGGPTGRHSLEANLDHALRVACEVRQGREQLIMQRRARSR